MVQIELSMSSASLIINAFPYALWLALEVLGSEMIEVITFWCDDKLYIYLYIYGSDHSRIPFVSRSSLPSLSDPFRIPFIHHSFQIPFVSLSMYPFARPSLSHPFRIQNAADHAAAHARNAVLEQPIVEV